jgi:hypothetical protein
MDILLALGLVLGIPTIAALFIAREAELYKERERNRRD